VAQWRLDWALTTGRWRLEQSLPTRRMDGALIIGMAGSMQAVVCWVLIGKVQSAFQCR